MVLRKDKLEIGNSRSKGDRMHSFRAAIILALCGFLAGPLTAAQGGQTPETRTNALTNKDVLEMLRAGLSQEVVIAKIKSSACSLDTSPAVLKELKAANVPEEVILAMVQAPAVASPSSAQVAANAPANTESRRIQNIAPEEMWKRVTQCVFPTYPALAFNSLISGAVDIGLGISPEGEVAISSRVLDGPALLVPSAMNAINQWKFRPNVVQGEVTWSRVRALVRFNADGTTAVDLAPGILADNFGDPGTPRSAAAAFPRPAGSPECKSVNEPVQAPRFVDGAYMVGIGGIGIPSCVACREPSYSDQARSAKISGIVVLHLIITAEGRAANIQVQRSLSYGLDEKAVKAVRNWRFKPAVGPEGKPVPVWTDIEVNFRIN
jgi:TonB family protein